MRFKLYTRANDSSDDPVITIGGLIPRIVAEKDAEAIATARYMIEDHSDRTRIGSWEIVEINRDDVCIRNVFEEAMKHPLIRFRVDAKFSDVGVAYIEATSQKEAEKKADNLDGGEFLVDSLATTGDAEIISVVALDDPCCPEGKGECSDEPGHVTPSEGHCLNCCEDDCTDCRPNEHVASFDDGFCCCTLGTGGHCLVCHHDKANCGAYHDDEGQHVQATRDDQEEAKV